MASSNTSMRHDYDLPFEWPSMTQEDKAEWYTQERVRRQAMQQKTATAQHHRKMMERQERRVSARDETVDIVEWR